MADNTTPIATLIERTEEYSKTTFDLFKMQAIGQSADVVSSFVSRLAVLLAFSVSILIITIGIALWIGLLLGSAYYGFFVTGGFYTILSLLLLLFGQRWIKTLVSNSIIIQLLKKKSS